MSQGQECAPKVLLIVDGHGYAYRAFHAIRSLTSPRGAPTNAIFGFVKTLLRLRAQLVPTHVVVVWDGGLASERLALLPEYKAQRPPMPANLACQLDPIVAWLRASGVASHCQDGVEADDWIATVARRAVAEGARVVIASSDKDFMQLVAPQVLLLNPNDKSEALWTADQVRAKSGVNPDQVVDWLSLVGDAVDNIPGVLGVGAKTAAGLLGRFGSVDELYRRLPEVESERLRTELAAAEPAVRRNQRMIALRDDLPGECGLRELAPGNSDTGRLRELYSDWGFRGLLAGLPSDNTLGDLKQGELF